MGDQLTGSFGIPGQVDPNDPTYRYPHIKKLRMVRVIELDPGALDPQLQTISFVHHPMVDMDKQKTVSESWLPKLLIRATQQQRVI